MSNGRDSDGFPYVETSVTNMAGDDYDLRFTVLGPRAAPGLPLPVHIDFLRASDGVSGRYENVDLDTRQGGEDGPASVRRRVAPLLGNTPIPSPVFP